MALIHKIRFMSLPVMHMRSFTSTIIVGKLIIEKNIMKNYNYLKYYLTEYLSFFFNQHVAHVSTYFK